MIQASGVPGYGLCRCLVSTVVSGCCRGVRRHRVPVRPGRTPAPTAPGRSPSVLMGRFVLVRWAPASRTAGASRSGTPRSRPVGADLQDPLAGVADDAGGYVPHPVAERGRLGVLQPVLVVEAQEPRPGGQVRGDARGQDPTAVDQPRLLAGSAGPSPCLSRRRPPQRRAGGARCRCTAGDGSPEPRESRSRGCSCR